MLRIGKKNDGRRKAHPRPLEGFFLPRFSGCGAR
jgi:hypothetical protein